MKLQDFFQKKYILVIGCLICCALWGSAFPCIKTGYRIFEIASGEANSQILFAGTRFFMAGILAILFGSIQAKKPLIPSGKAIPKICVLALFQTIGQYVLFYIGLANTTAVKGSIISGSSAFFSIIMACIFLKGERMSQRKLIGCILGFAGIILVNLAGLSASMSLNLFGDGLMLLSTISSALSALLIKVFSKNENTVLLSGWQFLIGGAVMILVGASTKGTLQHMSAPGFLLLLYMALISSVAYTLWGILIKYNSVSKVSIFGFFIPIMGVMLSALVLKDTSDLSIATLGALALVCVGTWFVNRSKEKRTETSV